MAITFGVFNKIEGSDRYALTQLITSPYETESLTDEVMVKDITSFDKDIIDVETVSEENIASTVMLSFGTDDSVALHPDIDVVEIVQGQLYDSADGINEVKVTIDDQIYSTRFTSTLGTYLRTTYPTGYTAP